MSQRARRMEDAAVSDQVGTLLLVLAVVVLGGAVAVIVSSNLSRPIASEATFALAPIEGGDTTLTVILRNGEPISLPTLRLTVDRDGSAPVDIAPDAWTTSSPTSLAAGDNITFSIAPAVEPTERIRVRVFRTDVNALSAEILQSARGSFAPSANATLRASVAPLSIPADAVSATLLEVMVAHPWGTATVARVDVNLTALGSSTNATLATLLLRDDGFEGDRIGGDGVWSTLVRAPAGTRTANYTLGVNATDIQGRNIASTTTSLRVAPLLGTPATGRFVVDGDSFEVPTSVNATSILLRNFSYDTRHASVLAGDVIAGVVSDERGNDWWFQLALDYASNTASARDLRVWHAGAETTYRPVGAGGRVPLAGLSVNLTNPTSGGVYAFQSGSAHPTALYAAAGVWDTARVNFLRIGDDATFTIAATSIHGVEVVFR